MLSNMLQPFGYLSQTKGQKWCLWILTILGLLAAWQFFPGALMPRPLGTWHKVGYLLEQGVVEELGKSLGVILRSALYAFPLGCLLSYMYTIGICRPLVLIVASFRNISMIVLVAGFLLAHMIGDELKVVTMTFIIVVYFVSSVIQLFDDIPQDEIDHAVTMRMSPWQILWHRVIRGKLHLVYYAFIPCLAMGWSMLSFVEGYARDQGGIGELMLQQDKISSFEGLAALGLISVAAGFAMWLGLWFSGRKVFRYATAVAIHI